MYGLALSISGRTASCAVRLRAAKALRRSSAEPPSPHKPPDSVISNLQRGVISILHLQAFVAVGDYGKFTPLRREAPGAGRIYRSRSDLKQDAAIYRPPTASLISRIRQQKVPRPRNTSDQDDTKSNDIGQFHWVKLAFYINFILFVRHILLYTGQPCITR